MQIQISLIHHHSIHQNDLNQTKIISQNKISITYYIIKSDKI